MKRLFVFLLAIFSLGNIYAQKDKKAKSILDAMSTKYKSLDSFQASLQQEIISTSQGKLGTMNIEATVKGDKYKLVINEQEIYNNTETVWRYVKDIDEVTIEDADPDAEDLMSAPSKIYTIYEKGFKYLYLGEQTIDGVTYQVVDLSPDKSINVSFFKLTMYIDKKDNTLRQWEVFEKGNATKYVFKVKEFRGNVAVTDKDFEFDVTAHSEAEVVDLR